MLRADRPRRRSQRDAPPPTRKIEFVDGVAIVYARLPNAEEDPNVVPETPDAPIVRKLSPANYVLDAQGNKVSCSTQLTAFVNHVEKTIAQGERVNSPDGTSRYIVAYKRDKVIFVYDGHGGGAFFFPERERKANGELLKQKKSEIFDNWIEAWKRGGK